MVSNYVPPSKCLDRRDSDDHIVFDLVFSHPELLVKSYDLRNWSLSSKQLRHSVSQNVRKLILDDSTVSGKLHGLNQLRALEELRVDSDDVTDVSALAALTTLIKLDISAIQVTDVSALHVLQSVEY